MANLTEKIPPAADGEGGMQRAANGCAWDGVLDCVSATSLAGDYEPIVKARHYSAIRFPPAVSAIR